MSVPPSFNIGVACTDAHIGRPAADRIAMIVEDAERGTSQLTFAELAELTRRFAQALRKLAVDAGERVLIRLPNCLAYPIVFLGAMKRGAIPVPSSILLTAEEIGYLMDDSGASVLVIDRRLWGLLVGQMRNAHVITWLATIAREPCTSFPTCRARRMVRWCGGCCGNSAKFFHAGAVNRLTDLNDQI